MRNDDRTEKVAAGMSRGELLVELARLHERESDNVQLEAVVHELRVHQEELAAQQEELVETQRAAEVSRDRYLDLYDFAPIAYVTLDRNGVIEEINLTGAALLQTERAGALTSPFVIFVEEPDRRAFFDHMSRCRSAEGPVTTELRLRTRLGGLVPVQLVTKRSPGPSGSDFRSAITDLTAAREAEEARFRAEEERQTRVRVEEASRAAAEAKDRFLAMLSHELRTPLTPILSMVTGMEASGRIPADLQPMCAMVRRNIELEVKLIDDLLDITRIAKGKLHLQLKPVDVHALLVEVVDICEPEAREAGLTVALDLTAKARHVDGDANRLRQVFWNLLKNAIRYTLAGGRVTVRSEVVNGRLCVAFVDTGIGIERDDLGRIFLPFQQSGPLNHANARGLGLGLPICRGIIEAHGGEIRASSEGRGHGARFEVELATTEAPEVAPEEERISNLPSSRGIKILIVEDHADTAEALSYLLGSQGYRIALADSVQTALALPIADVDLVISDLGLPDGSGLDLMRTLRAAKPVKGIALSGYGTEDDIREAELAGFAGHLTKPIDFTRLLEMIATVTAP